MDRLDIHEGTEYCCVKQEVKPYCGWDLNQKYYTEDSRKSKVVEYPFKRVQIAHTHHAAVDHVESLEEDESAEYQCHVRFLGLSLEGEIASFWDRVRCLNSVIVVEPMQLLAKENQSTHYQDIPKSNSVYLSPNNLVEQLISRFSRLLTCRSVSGWNSSQG